MKISKIEIKDFHQFKNFTLDLTYPQGHPKAGQPLDKVCFIGQSGTGKTTLLELIPLFLYWYHGSNLVNQISGNNKYYTLYDNIIMTTVFGTESDRIFHVSISKKVQSFDLNFINKFSLLRVSHKKTAIDFYETWQNIIASKLIYFPANLNFDLENIDTEKTFDEDKIIDFSKTKVSNVWNVVTEKIQAYQEQELKIRQDISKVAETSSSDLEAIQKAVKQLEDWKKSEFNPVKDVADNCLDRLLANYKLRVKTELDFKTKNDIGFIKIEDYNGNEIPHGLWSTGTKQVILSALPLYLLKPKHTVILFDEPERSLYPDLQRFVIDYYSSLATNCQFFYSTHSPIIASAFEPWEIVELKFNDQAEIYREVYYEGENHVDNYKWNPKYMRWDDILQRVFDIKDDGSPARKEKLDELATLNVKYRKLTKKGEENSPEAVEIVKQIEKLSKDLSKWD